MGRLTLVDYNDLWLIGSCLLVIGYGMGRVDRSRSGWMWALIVLGATVLAHTVYRGSW